MTLGAFAVAFGAGVLLDFFWAMYMLAVAERKKLKAAFSSVLCAVPSIAGITMYVENRVMIAPYLLGLFFGTWLYLSAREIKSEEEL